MSTALAIPTEDQIKLALGPQMTDANHRKEAHLLLIKVQSEASGVHIPRRRDGLRLECFPTEAEYVEHHPDGPAPVQIEDPTLNAFPTNAANIAQRDERLKNYLHYRAQCQRLVTMVASRMHPAYIAQHASDDVPLLHRPIHWWVTQLRALGAMTPAEINALLTDLRNRRMQDSEDFITIRAAATAAFQRIAAQGGQVLERDKVGILCEMVADIAEFKADIRHHKITHPTEATLTFTGTADVIEAADRQRARPATVASLGYTAHTQPSSSLSAIAMAPNSDLAAKLAAAEARLATLELMTAEQHRARTARRDRHPRNTQHYCWTHGSCAHPSHQCRTKAAGHVDGATAADRRGGAPAK